MSASNADYFIKVTPGFSTTIASGGVASGVVTTIPLVSVSGLPTDTAIELVINRVNSSGAVTNNPETIRGVVSGTNIVNCVRGVEGTAQAWSAGTVVEYLHTADIQNRLATGILVEHNQDGTHASTIVTTTGSQTLTNKTLTSPKINENVAVTATSTEINLLHGKTSLGAFWSPIPGSPAYASSTTITITDTGNANKYDLMFKKGVIIKWTDSAGTAFKLGMVTASSYSTDVVTITITGSAVASGDKDFKYCMLPAEEKEFIVVGTLATGTDLARTHYPKYDVYPLCADAYVKTAGSTNASTFDILDDGTSIMPSTTTISIASGATNGLDYACNAPTTAIAKDSVVTLSITGVSTTPPVEAYVKLFVMPVNWRYLT